MACTDMPMGGHGTVLYLNIASNWVYISNVMGLTVLDTSTEFVETTSINSPSGWLEFEATFKNPGSITLTMPYVKVNFDMFWSQYINGLKSEYHITLPDGEVFYFNAMIEKLPITVKTGGMVTMNISLKLSGEIL